MPFYGGRLIKEEGEDGKIRSGGFVIEANILPHSVARLLHLLRVLLGPHESFPRKRFVNTMFCL